MFCVFPWIIFRLHSMAIVLSHTPSWIGKLPRKNKNGNNKTIYVFVVAKQHASHLQSLIISVFFFFCLIIIIRKKAMIDVRVLAIEFFFSLSLCVCVFRFSFSKLNGYNFVPSENRVRNWLDYFLLCGMCVLGWMSAIYLYHQIDCCQEVAIPIIPLIIYHYYYYQLRLFISSFIIFKFVVCLGSHRCFWSSFLLLMLL